MQLTSVESTKKIVVDRSNVYVIELMHFRLMFNINKARIFTRGLNGIAVFIRRDVVRFVLTSGLIKAFFLNCNVIQIVKYTISYMAVSSIWSTTSMCQYVT